MSKESVWTTAVRGVGRERSVFDKKCEGNQPSTFEIRCTTGGDGLEVVFYSGSTKPSECMRLRNRWIW